MDVRGKPAIKGKSSGEMTSLRKDIRVRSKLGNNADKSFGGQKTGFEG
jgi:hypothetical protein